MKIDRNAIVAIIGKPNVGKSSFFNRLVGRQKAIVDATPGVTRDRHYHQVTWREYSFILIDTGGIEMDLQKSLNDRIKNQSLQAIDEADYILFMLDGKGGLSIEDYEIFNLLRKSPKPVFYVVNKIDGPEKEVENLSHFYELGVKSLYPVSAAHGYGVPDFMDMLCQHFKSPESAQPVTDSIRLACIGRPNVGKSSLINRLLGEDRMVVSEIPGTTRDSVDISLQKGGKRYTLIDTAGIRRKGKVHDKLEKFSIIHALSAMERCDIALVLLDASEGIAEQDTKIIGYALERGRAFLVLINKWDLVKEDSKKQKWITEEVERATRFIGYAPTLHISALTGAGVNRIFAVMNKVYEQYNLSFPTNKLNRILQDAVDAHYPGLYKGRRVKMLYVTQIGSKPPTFIIFTNLPKGVHFSYHRYLVNAFRQGLGIEYSPIRLFFRNKNKDDKK